MRSLRAFLLRLAAPFTGSRGDAEFRDELESHLQLHIADNLRAGMPPEEARRLAIVKLGGITQTIERQREQRGLPFVDALRQDLLYTVRTLRANPGFALTAILTLALGIGATSAIFSAVNAVLLRPLPFSDPNRLVMIYGVGGNDDRHESVSYPTFVDWRDQSHSFESMAAFANATLTIAVNGSTELVRGKRVTSSMFHVLGVQPAVGRAFTADDIDRSVVILSDGFWKRHFAGNNDAVGKTLRIMDAPFTVIGVMPAGFHIEPPGREQLYASLPPDATRNHEFVRLIARLAPGVSRPQARSDLDGITANLRRQYGRNSASEGATVEPLVDALAGPGRTALLTLLAVVSLVLLIACTNVANLLLARGATRRREMAVRAALGAGRGRLVRQLLTESLVLALAGGAAGLLLSQWLGALFVKVVSDFVEVPRLDATRIDGQVLLFTTIVSVATGVVFGVVPALSSAAPDLSDAMRDSGYTASGVRAPRLRRALVVVETALAVVLLAAAGMLMRTLITMRSTEPGFNTSSMLAVDIWLPPARFARLQDRVPLFQGVLERVRELPGVRAAAFVADLPLSGATDTEGFHIVGRADPAPDRWHSSGFNITTASYFEMMGISIHEGRGFLASDGPMAPGVIVVNEAAARRFWPGRSPIGEQIQLPITRERAQLLTVVGVVADVRHRNLVDPPHSEIYVNSLQTELTWMPVVLAVRTQVDPKSVAEPIKAIFREVNPAVPIARISTMDEVVARSLAEPRLYSWLFAAFAVAAVSLAAIGLYGLISFSVTQRSKEIGVRVALGASRSEVMLLVLREGLGLASIGAVVGLVGGVAATRSLVGLINGVTPTDPSTFVAVIAVLLGAAAIACYLPARRAARLDPLRALRTE
jgi:predicted permease